MVLLRLDDNMAACSESEQSGNRSTRTYPNIPAIFRRTNTKAEIIHEQKPDCYIKIVLSGDCGSGKTALLNIFSCSMHQSNYVRRPSYDDNKIVACVDRIMQCSGSQVFVRLYDTAGMQFNRNSQSMY